MAGGLYTHTTRTTSVSESEYNADHQNHITNAIPEKIDDYSEDTTEMRQQTDPGESGSESPATSLAGEIERLRFCLAEMKGTTYWYETGTYQAGTGTTQTISGNPTTIDFTGIPSYVVEWTIAFSLLGTNSTSAIMVRLGDSGGVESTGYTGTVQNLTTAGAGNFNTGFNIHDSTNTASRTYEGALHGRLIDATNFTWVVTGMVGLSNTTGAFVIAGTKSLSATLDRLQITTGGGTDTFDTNGVVNILYRG